MTIGQIKKITVSCFHFFFETRQLLSSSIPEWYQQTKTRLCQTKGFIFITMKIIVQGTHWWVLINKSTDVPLDTVAKKLNNIVVLQSWDGLYLQQEMKLEHNPFLQIWTINVSNGGCLNRHYLRKEFFTQLLNCKIGTIEHLHRRFPVFFQLSKENSSMWALSY